MHVPTRFALSLWCALLTFILAGCKGEPAAVAPSAPKVTVQKLEPRPLTDYEEYNGYLETDQFVEVRSRVRGHIDKIHFTDGELVNKGDLLFELDPRPFQSDVDRANEQVKIYEAQHVAAVKEEARLRELLGKGGASQSQVDKAEADAKSFVAQISASQEEIKRKMLDLEYSQIKAEISGRTGRALLQEGNLVNAGGSDPLLTTLVSADPIRVYFNVDERTLLRYANNMGVEGKNLTEMMAKLKDAETPFSFALDGETTFEHQGKLRFGDNRIDPATGTLQVYGSVDNKDGKLVPGSRVRVRLPIGKPYTSLLIPETAILADQDKRYVLVVDAKNVVLRRNVTLGRLTDDGMRAIRPESVEVSDPPEKWSVLVDNLQRARLNYPIDPQTSTPAPAEKPDS